jgi:uncharacterized protein YbgA (DUF1722 family)
LCQVINDYRQGVLPLLAPMTLLKHHMNRYPDGYLQQQAFLNPYPEELRLRYAL